MTGLADAARAARIARLTGLLYLFIMVSAMFAEGYVRGTLIAPGDGVLTIRNIATSEALWRWSIAADLVTYLCDIFVAALLFVLLKPAGPTVSLLATSLRLAYGAAMTASEALLLWPLRIHGGLTGRSASDLHDIQSQVMFAIGLHDAAIAVGMILFGVHLALIGGLIMRATYLPRLLGAALAVAGVCYVVNSLVGFVAPSLQPGLFPWILLPGFLAEGALTLWLLIVGVNQPLWATLQQEQLDRQKG